LSLIGVGYLTAGLIEQRARGGMLASARGWLLPGPTTHGHYQIELACDSCHSKPFASAEDVQNACVGCHGKELKQAEDKHPLTKFLDPRNATLLERIDATMCVTCHTEHRPRMTNAMAVTLPNDLCAHCHENIAEDRPSHAGMAFDTCASAGCHNFHDNRALYEDFLLRHLQDADLAAKPLVATRDFVEMATMLPDYPSDRFPVRALSLEELDAPAHAAADRQLVDQWLKSTHAAAGANCSACHASAVPSNSTWVDHPDHLACETCHAQEVGGFMAGKHGMRLAQDMSPMKPAQARLPMREEAGHLELTCSSCHADHSFDTKRAAVDACLGCHADEHSLAYRSSKHFALWQRELQGSAPAGSGVSCATCHLPRIEHRDPEFDIRRTLVQHNQNDTLRPNEKMLRPVCLSCHGLQFSLDALADPTLIVRNFEGSSRVRVRSLEMAQQRLEKHEAQRRAAAQSDVQ
jgi:predicted CXXCH cytochrome family protein